MEAEENLDQEIINLVEKGILEIHSYKDGELYFRKTNKTRSNQKLPSIETTIKRLEEEYLRLENNGFPLPLEQVNSIYPELTEKSKRILLRFSGWLGEHKIILEICSQYEFSFPFGLYNYIIIQGNKAKPKQKSKLNDIIKRCLEVRDILLNNKKTEVNQL